MESSIMIKQTQKVLKEVGIKNPKIKKILDVGSDELGFRVARPLFVKNGKVYCTRCNALINESPENHACPECGQLYTDTVNY